MILFILRFKISRTGTNLNKKRQQKQNEFVVVVSIQLK
jgi:hypothetical protein